jgi:hypothetical protein
LTQASHSPSSVAPAAASAPAGPLRITVSASDGLLRDLIAGTLALYNVPWTDSPMRSVALDCVLGDAASSAAQGDYLVCAQMLVDATSAGLRATTTHGAQVSGTFDESGERWTMTVPRTVIADGFEPEVEDMLSLVLTTGWRRAGYVPLHAGGLTDGRRGLLVCAGSGGGKTTFTLAMARRGWKSLGDDKLLVAMSDRRVVAIKHMLNVDPLVQRWFPEIGDLTALPQYSAWTPKRRVSMARLLPAAPATEMVATHLLLIDRQTGASGITVSPMSSADAISALLHQSVVPHDPRVAAPIARTLATLGQRLTGLRATVGDDAYADAEALAAVEEALR